MTGVQTCALPIYNPLLTPTAAIRSAARSFKALSNAQLDDYTGRFQEITGQ